MKVRKGGKMDYDEETGKFKTDNEHVHPMGKEIERLFDNNMSKKNTIQDGSGEGGANSETTSMKKSAPGAKTTPRGKVNKGPGKRLKKTLFGGGPGGTVDESKKSELEVVVPEDFEVPEGWVVSEDGLEDVEYDVETIKALEELESSKQLELDDAQPPKSEGSKDHPKMKKSKKAKKRTNINGGGEAIEKDSVLELDENEEIPEDYLVIENTSDITDETCNDSDKFYDEFFVPEILKIADEDAIMSSEDRSKLGSAEACGPNRSFPINDSTHIQAARALLERSQISDNHKAKVRAAIERRARKLGCDTTQKPKNTGVVTLKLGDNEYAIADLKGLNKAMGQVNAQLIRDNADDVFQVAKLFGVDREKFDDACGKDVVTIAVDPRPLEEKATELETQSTEKFTDATIEMFVNRLLEVNDAKRQELTDKLLDALIAKNLIPNYDAEYTALLEERDSLALRLAEATESNKDLYLARQNFYADAIVEFKVALGKEGYTELDDDARAQKLDSLTVLSLEALKKEMDVLTKELIDRAKSNGLGNNGNAEPGSVSLPNEVKDSVEPKQIDVHAMKGMNPQQYQAYRRLQNAFKQNGRSTRRQS
jgi:hypothetical protein